MSSRAALWEPPDAGNFDHEGLHAAIPFYTNGREYRALGRRYGTDENGRITGEEDLVQDMLRVIRQNRAIENYATAPERILWKVGQRIRSFTSMVTGKDFKQIAEELRTGRLQDRGVVTDSAEQVRRGARMTLPGQPAVPAGPAPTETGNADAQGGVPVPGTPVEPGAAGGPEGPGGGVAPVAGTAQAQPPAAPAPAQTPAPAEIAPPEPATWRTNAGGVCQVPLYIKLTEEFGDWGGNVADAKLPDYFRVDYVRVYREKETR